MSYDENSFTDPFVGDFINEEPAVFKGLTDGEIKNVGILSFFIGIPIGLFVGFVTGVVMLALPAMLLMPIVNVYFLAGWVEKRRRGKPVGYIEHISLLWLYKWKCISAPFVCDSYKWGLGRTERKQKS